MALGISVYDAGRDNEISNGQCSDSCSNPQSIISNLKWVANDAVEGEGEGEMIVGEPTDSLDECEAGCTECRKCWNEFTPDVIEITCMDKREMKYNKKCPNKGKWRNEKCSSEGKCHQSYPFGDPDKMRSADAACRTVPDALTVEDKDAYGWSKKKCKSKNGMCGYGCNKKTEMCRNSYLIDDADKWRSPSAMCRCGPKFL